MSTNNLFKNNQGTVLFMTMLILTGMLVVVLGAANLVTQGIKMSGGQERSTIAYFAAEAGAERILWEIRNNSFNFGGCSVGNYIDFDIINIPPNSATCDFSEHSYILSNNALYSVVYSSNSPITFTSSGVFSDVNRSVDISY